MNGAEQQTATKKRTWLGVQLAIYALLAVIAAAFYFGMNSIEQWDVSTGQGRYVTTVVGVPVWFGAPRPTTVSEWLHEPEGEKDWIQVRGPSIRKAKVSHCVHDLLGQLHMWEGELAVTLERNKKQDGKSLKHRIAAAILDELRTTQSICRVSRHCSEFRMQFIETYWHNEEPLTLVNLEDTWRMSGRLASNLQTKP